MTKWLMEFPVEFRWAVAAAVDTYMDLAVDIDHVPRRLELTYVRVTQQRVLLIGVEQREVLHDDS